METNLAIFDKKIKILDFSPYYPPHIGGLEKYAEELHENLSKKNCEIVVFTPHFPKTAPKEEIKPGIKIIRYPAVEIIFCFPFPCIWKREFWRQWKKISNSYFDIAISTSRFFIQPSMAFFYSWRKKIPLLHIEHGSDFVKNTPFVSLVAKIFDETLGRFILSHADKVIAPSQSAARFVKLLSHRIAPVIYRGMPFAEIDSIAPETSLKEKFRNKTIITYVGRLIYGKGVVHLIEALSNLNKKNSVLLIVGDGPLRESIEECAKKNRVNNQVIFLGNIAFEKAIAILKITDIFVNPSYNEGLPTSVLEAGVCRKAILATNVGGTPEIIRNGVSGVIIEPHSVKALKEALGELLDNPEKRKMLGENARQEIEQKFNWENSIEAYIREINSIIKK
ncbi:MAG: glycosyltransferase family 4 protein [Patescibacteria group bacterium]